MGKWENHAPWLQFLISIIKKSFAVDVFSVLINWSKTEHLEQPTLFCSNPDTLPL